MLNFRFNIDNFKGFKQEQEISEYKGEIQIKPTRKEIVDIGLGQIQSYFFKKLEDELNLSEIGLIGMLHDILDIPTDFLCLDDEKTGNLDGAIKYVFSQYINMPIEELDNNSLSDLGISIEFGERILNADIGQKVYNYMEKNNVEVFTEELLYKNMNDKQKAQKFTQYLNYIESENSELIVIDPYLFTKANNNSSYCNLLGDIFNLSKAKSILIITDKNNYYQNSFGNIVKLTNISLKVVYSNDFHDRFWISKRSKGFCTGTSLNGIGKRFSLIQMIEADDIQDIVSELINLNLIN